MNLYIDLHINSACQLLQPEKFKCACLVRLARSALLGLQSHAHIHININIYALYLSAYSLIPNQSHVFDHRPPTTVVPLATRVACCAVHSMLHYAFFVNSSYAFLHTHSYTFCCCNYAYFLNFFCCYPNHNTRSVSHA